MLLDTAPAPEGSNEIDMNQEERVGSNACT